MAEEISESPVFAGYGSGSTPASFAPTRFLEIRYNSVMGTSYAILDQADSAKLFKVKIHPLTENLTMISSNGKEIGSTKNHTFSSKIDLAIHGHSKVLTKSDQGKDSMEFQSPACAGARTVWRDAGSWNGLDMICVGKNGMPLAKMHLTKTLTSLRKLGRIELADSAAADGALLDEMVITGLATAHARLNKLIAKLVFMAL